MAQHPVVLTAAMGVVQYGQLGSRHAGFGATAVTKVPMEKLTFFVFLSL